MFNYFKPIIWPHNHFLVLDGKVSPPTDLCRREGVRRERENLRDGWVRCLGLNPRKFRWFFLTSALWLIIYERQWMRDIFTKLVFNDFLLTLITTTPKYFDGFERCTIPPPKDRGQFLVLEAEKRPCRCHAWSRFTPCDRGASQFACLVPKVGSNYIAAIIPPVQYIWAILGPK